MASRDVRSFPIAPPPTALANQFSHRESLYSSLSYLVIIGISEECGENHRHGDLPSTRT